jgi:hypothetical protein
MPRILVVRISKNGCSRNAAQLAGGKEGPTLGCLSVVWVEAEWDTRLEATENFGSTGRGLASMDLT